MIADDLAAAIPARPRALMNELIVRIAARGDGVTRAAAMCRSACPATRCSTTARSRPGRITRSRRAVTFPECGGCQLQHADDEAYRGYLVSRVETALAQHDLETEIRAPHLSPPNEPPARDACGR